MILGFVAINFNVLKYFINKPKTLYLHKEAYYNVRYRRALSRKLCSADLFWLEVSRGNWWLMFSLDNVSPCPCRCRCSMRAGLALFLFNIKLIMRDRVEEYLFFGLAWELGCTNGFIFPSDSPLSESRLEIPPQLQ